MHPAMPEDRRYRELFEAYPRPMFVEDWSRLKPFVDQLRARGIVDFVAHFANNPNELAHIPALVDWVDINSAAIATYGLSSMQELVHYFKTSPNASFHQYPYCIQRFVGGESFAEIENIDVTPSGEKVYLVETFRLPAAYREDWSRVFAGVNDITSLKATEAALRGEEQRYKALFEETRRLLHFEEERGRELSTLVSLSEATTRSLDATTIIRIAGDKIREIFRTEVSEILLYDELSGMIDVPYSYYDGYKEVESFPMGVGLTSQILRTKEPLISNSSEDQAVQQAIVLSPSDATESYMGAPIVSGEKTIGVVSVQSYQRGAFTDNHLRLLQIFGSNIGVALENARLFEESQKLLAETNARNAELAFVNGIQEALARGLNAQ